MADDGQDQISLFDNINWPENIDETVFLREYWQRKPLLIRQAFPDFDTPLPADELAGLALEDDANARIITKDTNGDYHLEHGPFNEERFANLPAKDWALLVTDVEKLLPEFSTYLEAFRFIPDWRIDDLMVSYAPDGASVGAHIDEYDVFLLQASGVRTWHIDSRTDAVHELRASGDLKILSHFSSTHTWDLDPGDMLYLPPHMAHHGIALGDDCMTWSIGFRAPLASDMVNRMAELISENLPYQRYTDGPLTPAKHGEIDVNSVNRFKALWAKAVQMDDVLFAQMLGRWLTEPGQLAPNPIRQETSTAWPSTSDQPMIMQKSSYSLFAWHAISLTSAALFVDGQSYECTLHLATSICKRTSSVEVIPEQLNTADTEILQSLLREGCLYVG